MGFRRFCGNRVVGGTRRHADWIGGARKGEPQLPVTPLKATTNLTLLRGDPISKALSHRKKLEPIEKGHLERCETCHTLRKRNDSERSKLHESIPFVTHEVADFYAGCGGLLFGLHESYVACRSSLSLSPLGLTSTDNCCFHFQGFLSKNFPVRYRICDLSPQHALQCSCWCHTATCGPDKLLCAGNVSRWKVCIIAHG